MDIHWGERVNRVLAKRWVIFFIMGAAFFIAVAHRSAPVIVADKLMAEFSISSTLFGYLVATYFFVYTLMQIPSGMLADYWGPRKTVTAGVLLAGIGSFLFGLSTSLNFLLASRFLVGLGCSVIFVGILKVVAGWFRVREFATLSGITTIIGSLGSMTATYPLAALVENIGWRACFKIVGIISVVTAVLCWLLVRNRPAELGLPSIDEIEAKEQGAVMLPAEKVPALFNTPGQDEQAMDIGIINALRLTLGNRFTWPPFFSMMSIYGPTTAFVGVVSIPYFMQIYGLSREQAAGVIFTLSAGGAISGPFIGYLSDKVFVSRKKPYLIFAAIYFCSWMVFLFSNKISAPLAALYPLLFIMGFASNSIVLTWVCAKEVNHPSIAGIASGTANGGGMLGVALLQAVSGFLLDLKWQGALQNGVPLYPPEAYRLVFLLLTMVSVLGLAAVLLIKETHAQNIYHMLIYNNRKKSFYAGKLWR